MTDHGARPAAELGGRRQGKVATNGRWSEGVAKLGNPPISSASLPASRPKRLTSSSDGSPSSDRLPITDDDDDDNSNNNINNTDQRWRR